LTDQQRPADIEVGYEHAPPPSSRALAPQQRFRHLGAPSRLTPSCELRDWRACELRTTGGLFLGYPAAGTDASPIADSQSRVTTAPAIDNGAPAG